jgi:hypothetical protein
MFADPQGEQWRSAGVDRRIRGELRAVLNQYLYDLVGHKLKMHAHLGAICN